MHKAPVDHSEAHDPDDKALDPGLYILATPIGNLGDITLRALDILRRCDGVACEDTRVTGRLLHHYGISKPLWRYDDHAGERDRQRLVDSLGSRAVVLASDAGTPLVSDPGFRLVNAARDAGHAVTTLPGACAPIAALTLSGLPNDRFLFAGFVPTKEKARREWLEALADIEATLLMFETAPRLGKTLATIETLWPERDVAVARELTKQFEECRRGSAAELAAYYETNPPKGEIVLLVGPPVKREVSAADIETSLQKTLAYSKPSQAAAEVARATGADRKALYALALKLREK